MVARTSFEQTTASIEPWYTGNIAPGISDHYLVTPLEEDVCFIDVSTQNVAFRIEGDGEPITAVAITPDGQWAAIASQSQQLRIVNVEAQQVTHTHRLGSPVYIATADARSSLFALGGSDGVVTVWDIAGGYVTHSLKGHGTTVSSVRFNNGDATHFLLASGDIMGTIKVWDLVKRKAIHTLNEHTAAVRGLGFVEDSRRSQSSYALISGGRDDVVILYNQSYRAAKVIPMSESVESCGFFDYDDEPCFYTGGNSAQLKVWSVSSLAVLAQTAKPLETSEELVIIDVFEVDDALVTTLSDQTIIYYDRRSLLPQLTLAGNHGIIADCKPVGDNLVLATNSPSVRIVRADAPLQVEFLQGHTDLVNGVDVSPSGQWMVTGGKDGVAIVWHLGDDGHWALHSSYSGHSGSVSSVAIARVDPPQFIITAGADLTIKKWKITKGENSTAIYTRRAHDKEINAVDISPNDEHLATASYDKTAKIWDIDSGETRGVLRGHRRGLWDIAFSPYAPQVATASGDKTAKVWSLQTFGCVQTLEGHTNSVQRVAWLNPESPQVVSTGADGLVKVWSSGEEVATLDGHDNRIWALAVTADAVASIITGDADGKIVVWHDVTDEMLKQQQEAEKQRVEDIQRLDRLVASNEMGEAFLLALTLGHSMKLYHVITQMEDDEQLAAVIESLDQDQLVSVLKRARDWNTNFRHFEAAQRVVAVVLRRPVAELHAVPAAMKIIDALVPYNQRHLARVDDMIEASYVLDYCVEEMA
ncbi:hypothetical protein DIURU_002906 [Diutina rugosa]|uniref:U3 small nucleolar RNA-associated protein 13 C-terminal domain-containing protein n=1 Tax=Diutina rugosa TaxID=5481 RepID=A0A642UNL4_DIURU|nr:uncharacterized protein DIURU_002906 [Diutina rugosa]KAA8902452.1 hypothetical protein DIURU_002906 [Diutina rugosa]